MLGAGALALTAKSQEGKRTMTAAPPDDQVRLQAYFDTETKYHPAPVPTPLDRAAAIVFVNARVNRSTTPDHMRKLMRLAVFYDLHETAAAFSSALTSAETQSGDITRSALCLIALAWIGGPAQQSAAQQYYHALQGRANIDSDRDIMLEVVEAFGPREGTGAHRQWVESNVRDFESRLRQEQARNNVPGAKLMQEKINALTEYLNIQLAGIDRAFALRQRIEATSPSMQIQSLVPLSLAASPEATPELSYWASMRLLRLASTLRNQIAAEFYRGATISPRPGQDLFRARALRAAEYFGQALPEPDRRWLSGQPDTGTDPLVLRPNYYLPAGK